MPKRLFITGPSGAGKSSLAALLQFWLHLPIVSLDSDPEAKEFWKKYDPDLKDNHMLLAREHMCQRVVQKAITDTENMIDVGVIIEGTHSLMCPYLTNNPYNYFIVVWPSKEVVVAQRVGRDKTKEKKYPIQDEEWEAARRSMAAILYERAVSYASHFVGQPEDHVLIHRTSDRQQAFVWLCRAWNLSPARLLQEAE